MAFSVRDIYQSKYISGEELKGRTHVLEVLKWEVAELRVNPRSEEVDTRILLSLKGAKKKLKLNKTSALTLAAAYGDNPDDWVGQRVSLDVERKNGHPRLVGKQRSMVVMATPVAGGPRDSEPHDPDTGEVPYDGPPSDYPEGGG